MSAEDLTPESIGQPAFAETDRSQFINRTYTHLLGAIFLFAGIEFWVFQTPYAEQLALFMLQKSWLAVLGAFIVVSWIASHIAHRVESKGAQYVALGGFVLAEAVIFIPMFYIALAVSPEIVEYAVAVTLGAFIVLSAVGFAGASILYDTSRIIRDYPEDRYIAAALELFASIALMLWYVLRFFLSRD